MTRETRRQVLRALRRNGCTCCPTISETPVELAGLGDGLVRHQAGCEYGDRFAWMNDLGVIPRVELSSRCDR